MYGKIKKRIYLDNAATTQVSAEVFEEMKRYWNKEYGNPGGIYKEGVIAHEAVESARTKVAALLSARKEEVLFTGSGTEANNLALLGVAEKYKKEGRAYADMHFVTSSIEHSSVLEVCGELEKRGAEVTYVGVTKEGVLELEELKKALTPRTVMVSVMYANNEIGTIQPLFEIRKYLSDFKKRNFQFPPGRTPTAGQAISPDLSVAHRGSSIFVKKNRDNFQPPIFHADASNVPSYLDVNAQKLGVDMMTLDAQKIYGPKGVGALYVKKGIIVEPIFYGGGQEFGIRPGTENVPLIAGFALALESAVRERDKEFSRLTLLRDYFIQEVRAKIPRAELNGDPHKRLPNNAHFSFPGYDNEWLALQLDARGIAVGMKSACLSGEKGGSYVVEALGKGKEHSKSCLRFTLGRHTTKRDVAYVIRELKSIINT